VSILLRTYHRFYPYWGNLPPNGTRVFEGDTLQPDRDPDLTPPPGRYQPMRGFGKLWRGNTSVRERIGWATAPEQGFEGTWQQLRTEFLGGEVFLRTIDGQVVLFSGFWMAGGHWRLVTP
jgi:hypothetical protein